MYRKKTTQLSVRTVSGNKRVIESDDDHDDEDEASGGGSPQTSNCAVKKRKINRNGLVTLTDGVVSMRDQCWYFQLLYQRKAVMMMRALCLTPSSLGAIRMHCSLL